MLFRSTAATFVNDAIRSARMRENELRKQDAEKRINFYHDQQVESLREDILRVFPNRGDDIRPVFINLTRKIIDQLSMVYIDDALREVDGSESDQAVFGEIEESTALPIKMKRASRYVKLLKTVMVRPVWRNDRMDLDIITPDRLDVTCGDTPEDIQSVMVTHYVIKRGKEEIEYSLWTPERFRRLDYRGKEISSEDNPYGVIPFVPMWDECPTDTFFLPGGDDLVVAQEALNERLSDLCYVLRQQAFGVGYLKSTGKGGSIPYGAGTFVDIPESGEIGFVSPNAPIEETVEAISFLLKQVAIMNGLPASSLSSDPNEQSGIARIVENRELAEFRNDDIALFRIYEKRLFDMFRIVWNAHNTNRRISDKADLAIDFYEPKPSVDPMTQADIWEAHLRLGVISPVDIAMERNPDLQSRQSALEYLREVRQESAALAVDEFENRLPQELEDESSTNQS